MSKMRHREVKYLIQGYTGIAFGFISKYRNLQLGIGQERGLGSNNPGLTI